MRRLKGRDLLDYWRRNEALVPVSEYKRLEGRYHTNEQMLRHENYVREAVSEVMNNGFMMNEIGVNVCTKSSEFDVVGTTESGAVLCVEVKCSPRRESEARSQLVKFKDLMPNTKTRLYCYIGKIGLMEEVLL